MTPFTDPRTKPEPSDAPPERRTTSDPEPLRELHQLCREGRLYAVEAWIQDGKPLQLSEDAETPRGRWSTALEIALDRGDHALVHLLLCNGYDPNLERRSPLDAALQAKRLDLLDLLLAWGADPHQVDPDDLFGTYDSKLFGRFRELGVDLTKDHALAWTLAHHTSNKPLFGFARRLRKTEPKIQSELNAALAYHAREGNERGVALSLWAGADPHAPACSLRWCDCEGGEEPSGSSAIREACRNGNVSILETLGPDPEKDDFDDLYEAADTRRIIEHLMEIAPPCNPDEVIQHHIWEATFDSRWSSNWWSTDTLETLFKLGVRWRECSKDEVANIRRWFLRTSKRKFVETVKVLAKEDYVAPEILHELARTQAMRKRMKKVGFLRYPDEEKWKYDKRRPTRFLEVRKKFGLEPQKGAEKAKKKSKDPGLPRTIEIGSRRRGGREIRLSRADLKKKVWSEPVARVAEEWGLSDNGLRKHCRKMKIPLPPRGYWPKVWAGKKPKKPRLPRLPKGQAEEIVVWVPE